MMKGKIMRKYIFIFCLLHNAIYSMENVGILGSTTEFICINYGYNPEKVRKDIQSLYYTNKFLHDYYAQEKNVQKIIRLCSSRFSHNGTGRINSNDEDIAKKLGCRTIQEKIDKLSTTVRDKETEFTAEDLQ